MTNITSLRSLKILLTLTLVVSACACDPPRLTRGSVKTALKQYEGKSTSMFFPDSDWCLFSFSEGKKNPIHEVELGNAVGYLRTEDCAPESIARRGSAFSVDALRCRLKYTDKGLEFFRKYTRGQSPNNPFRPSLWLKEAEEWTLVPVATQKVTGVTGIVSQGNTAQAEFTWRWEPTEALRVLTRDCSEQSCMSLLNTLLRRMGLGSDLSNEWSGSASFVRYDDGWRIRDVDFRDAL